ncbi:hypothetical protein I317_05578 [Kwoniella heveanensis CBS 569]|nr:hypothetical protein I317_05578 [Kwoniella heveanensis CBS 569]
MSTRTCSFSSHATDPSCPSMTAPSESASTSTSASVVSPSMECPSPTSPISEVDMNLNMNLKQNMGLDPVHCLTPYPDSRFQSHLSAPFSPDSNELPSPLPQGGDSAGSTCDRQTPFDRESNTPRPDLQVSQPKNAIRQTSLEAGPSSVRDQACSDVQPSLKGDQTARPPGQHPQDQNQDQAQDPHLQYQDDRTPFQSLSPSLPPSLCMSSLSSSIRDTAEEVAVIPPSPVRLRGYRQGQGHMRSRTAADLVPNGTDYAYAGQPLNLASTSTVKSGAAKPKLGRATTISADSSILIPSQVSLRSSIAPLSQHREAQEIHHIGTNTSTDVHSDSFSHPEIQKETPSPDAKRKPEPLDLNPQIPQPFFGMQTVTSRTAGRESLGEWAETRETSMMTMKRTKSRMSIHDALLTLSHDMPGTSTSLRTSGSSSPLPASGSYNPSHNDGRAHMDFASSSGSDASIRNDDDDDKHSHGYDRPHTPYTKADTPSNLSPDGRYEDAYGLGRQQSPSHVHTEAQPRSHNEHCPSGDEAENSHSMHDTKTNDSDLKPNLDRRQDQDRYLTSPSTSTSSSSRTPHPLTSRRVEISPTYRSRDRWDV